MFIGSKQLLIVLLLSEGFIFAMDKTRKQKNKEQKNDTRFCEPNYLSHINIPTK
ncbi:hypothetical protein KBB68_03310 [Candidatus Babeliales bacterium]|nr:hypothetical protein [Candidatus Babeliales bacterium]